MEGSENHLEHIGGLNYGHFNDLTEIGVMALQWFGTM